MGFEPTGPTQVHRITAPLPPASVVQTEFAGRLEFSGGFPTDATVQHLYDLLDFQRGCQAFVRNIMAAAVFGFVQGWRRDLRQPDNTIAVFHLDANGLLLTGNSETVYGIGILDLKGSGPLVLELPPRMLGLLNDMWMRPLGDLGIAGADQGQGGKYLILPPHFSGEVDEHQFVGVIRPRTFRLWLVLRAFMGAGGDPGPGTEALLATQIYPLASAENPARTANSDVTGVPVDTIHPTDLQYFRDLAEIIDHEPVDAIDPEVSELLAQIGIEKGKAFDPDDRMKRILEEAAQVGSFMAFSIANAPRDAYQRWEGLYWYANLQGYPEFRDEFNRPLVDLMARMAWFGTGRTLAMHGQQPGIGSAYTWTYRDANGDWINPSTTYRLRLPGPIPAKDFWSVVVYDLWTRSMLANGQPFPSLNSYSDGVQLDDDGGVTVYIGPEPPDGQEANWIRTMPETGWFPILRIYGPLEEWIDGSWRPSDLEPMR